MDERDPPITGDDETESDETKVVAFLLCMTTLCDRCAIVRGVDVGREVRHVEDESRALEVEQFDDAGSDGGLDLIEHRRGELIHRVPEPAVIARTSAELHEPVAGCRLPPVCERKL